MEQDYFFLVWLLFVSAQVNSSSVSHNLLKIYRNGLNSRAFRAIYLTQDGIYSTVDGKCPKGALIMSVLTLSRFGLLITRSPMGQDYFRSPGFYLSHFMSILF